MKEKGDKSTEKTGAGKERGQDAAPAAPRSEKLRRIMETPPGFWLGRGIALTWIVFLLLFLLLCLVPVGRYRGLTMLEYLLG